GAGGGGGSFNGGTSQNNVTGLNYGHGRVIFSWDALATIYVDQIDITGLTSGSTFPTGTTTLAYSVTDYHGDTDQCAFTITVEDNEAPVVNCLADTVYLNASGVGSTTTLALTGEVSDNCPTGNGPGGLASVAADQTDFDCAHVGINEVTLTAVDVNGNTNTCTALVTVLDTIAPVVNCQDFNLTLDQNGVGNIMVTDLLVNASDACNNPLPLSDLSLSTSEFSCNDTGINIIVLTAEDPSGNLSTCESIVTVVDATAPEAICQDILVELDNDGAAEIEPEELDGGSTDACADGSLTFSISSDTTIFGCGDVGTQLLTLLVEDGSGNVDSCTASVTVEDNVGPNMVCQDVTVLLGPSGTATITPDQVDNGSSDACGIDYWSWDEGTFDCQDIGVNNLTLSATDYNGNSSTCFFTATVIDQVSPELVCDDLTVQLDDAGMAIIVPADLGTTINEACDLTTLSLSQDTFTCANVGVQTITLTATDNSGNTSQCSADVTVEDQVEPEVLCQNVVVELDNEGAVELTTAQIDNGSNDACGIAGMSLSETVFGCGDVGTHEVTLTVTDNNGNSNNCVAVVTVADNIDPIALCQDVTIQLDSTGVANLLPEAVDNGSSDACGIENLTLTSTAFGCGDVGTHPVTLFVEDEHGNISSCSTTVTVEDNIAPVALCDDVTVTLDSSGVASVSTEMIDAGLNDGCDLISVTLDQTTFDCGDLGPNTVTLTVEDEHGNVSSCNATVTVEDNIAPVALCADITLQLDTGGAVILLPADLDNGSSDACGINIEFGDDLPSIIEFGCGEVGLQTVPIVVSDASGNSSTCSSVITIEDNVDPVALCQDVTVQLDLLGAATLDPAQIDNGSDDACGIESLSLDITSFDCSDIGAQTVMLIVEDENGNTSSCTATVTVEDDIAPSLDCQDITVQLDSAGLYNLTPGEITSIPSDGCGDVALSLDVSAFNCSDVGVNTVVLTVEDENENVNSCTVLVTVEDTIAPIALCQDITIQLDEGGAILLTPAQIDGGASDACGLLSTNIDIDEFGCGEVGVQIVTLTVTDNNENSSSCTSNVTVEDNINPVALCQDVTIQLDVFGSASLDASDIDNGSDDACGIESLSLDVTSFDCNDVGLQTVTLTVEDENGNTSSCTASVTIEDDIAPSLDCQNITVQLDSDGLYSLAPGEIAGIPSDGCGDVEVSLNVNEFDCSDIGVNTVVLTVEDENENVNSCTAQVIVEDTIAPTALCQDITVELDEGGAIILTPAQINAGSSDACGILSTTIDIDEFGCGEVGVQIVTLTVTDNNENSSSCTSNVTVEDNIDPVALCQDMTIQLDENGDASITADDINNGSNDACGIASLTLDQTAFDCGDVGSETVMLTVEDVNGNTSTCNASVDVEDVTPPVASCQDVTVALNAAGFATIGVDHVDGGTSDACGIAEIGLNMATFDCSDIGPNNVMLIARDFEDNLSACFATVTIIDTIAPVAVCQDLVIQLDASGAGSVIAQQIDGGSGDACG
ncbi:MAG: HYR domain-containing protein, partial [Phaeodactylibacter sp.]|nr:HYR domain-containing protein [Phaeodactylibacter sp.]